MCAWLTLARPSAFFARRRSDRCTSPVNARSTFEQSNLLVAGQGAQDDQMLAEVGLTARRE